MGVVELSDLPCKKQAGRCNASLFEKRDGRRTDLRHGVRFEAFHEEGGAQAESKAHEHAGNEQV